MRDNEGTRDPIFIVQRKWFRFYESARDLWDVDSEAYVDDAGEELTEQDLIDMEFGQWDWEYDNYGGIWYSRKEAEDWCKQHQYNLGGSRDSWRVWCTCANGELAKILKDYENKKEAMNV